MTTKNAGDGQIGIALHGLFHRDRDIAQTARQQRSAPRYGQSTHGRFARRGRMSSRPCVGVSSAGFTTVLAQPRLPLLSENLESRNRPSASRERVRRQAFSQIVQHFLPSRCAYRARAWLQSIASGHAASFYARWWSTLLRCTYKTSQADDTPTGSRRGVGRVTSRNSDHCQAVTTVSCNTGLRQGITASTIVPGWALVTRNSPPNSFAR